MCPSKIETSSFGKSTNFCFELFKTTLEDGNKKVFQEEKAYNVSKIEKNNLSEGQGHMALGLKYKHAKISKLLTKTVRKQ